MSESKKDKITKQIEAKAAELKKIEKRSAEALEKFDATGAATYNNQAARVRNQLEVLRAILNEAERTPAPIPDTDILLKGLTQHRAARAAKVRKIDNSILEAEEEAEQIAAALIEATADADAERALSLMDQKQQNEERRRCLYSMKENINNTELYPYGFLIDTWQQICADNMPVWESEIERVEELAAAYKTAISELYKHYNVLCEALRIIKNEAQQDGQALNLQPVFTPLFNTEKMRVDKNASAWIEGAKAPFMGKAL